MDMKLKLEKKISELSLTTKQRTLSWRNKESFRLTCNKKNNACKQIISFPIRLTRETAHSSFYY